MAENVEELFGGGAGTPQPRLFRIWLLLFAGLVVSILGLACLSAPGGVLVLLAVMFAETEKERVDNGYLPETDRSKVLVARTVAYLCLLFCTALFLVQCVLYGQGVYTAFGDFFFSGPPPEWLTAWLPTAA